MPLSHYVTLGRSGLRVSPLALGAMTFGEDPAGAGSSVAESEKILATYLDQGGNFIDTANFYTNGHSERILGDFFAAQPGRREHVVLASKFFGNMFPGDPNGGGAGRGSITAQLDATLRRLRTDYLDLYYLHSWDRHTPLEETVRALDDLVRMGKIRYVGFSNTPAWYTARAQTMAELSSWTPLIALQVEYSLLARTVPPRHGGHRLGPRRPRGEPGGRRLPGHRRRGRGRQRARYRFGGGVTGLAPGPPGYGRADRRGPAAGPPDQQPGRPGRDAEPGAAPAAGRGVGAGAELPGSHARGPAGHAPVS